MLEKSLTTAIVLGVFSLSATADSFTELNTPDKSGYMWGQLYKNTKAACGTLPQDLEDDYAKSIQLLSEASPEFESTYQDGLKPAIKKPPSRSAEERESDCNTGRSAMRTQVKLARFWFMGSW
ncbi:hypothetical protein RGV33_12285 [Pseudomonas sp. Bout1]|uniref:hypothetical protein n=1 Tax=Pseudomonas sp. Bout1 TaxID=3048600 RepID=UPI002AB39E45|nr:hypothetical protein [Pseudomonas sp. Bout1]MDY7532446.1 hypothetical protein [Pseudomonas sp. Bout1]MEB0184130.1 hypothetical protein [Pseudomonas sp. Bout1]